MTCKERDGSKFNLYHIYVGPKEALAVTSIWSVFVLLTFSNSVHTILTASDSLV